MDVREKLVELLHKGVRCPGVIDNCNDCPYYSFEKACDEFGATVDLLISHGVTVQEWISVKDRLPEDDSDVLAYLRIGEESRICPANYAKGMWFDWIFNTPVTESITHWMPIPQPPKGE